MGTLENMRVRDLAEGDGFPLIDTEAAEIGTKRQLFIDGYIVEKAEGVRKTLHPAEKRDNSRPLLVPDKPWETALSADLAFPISERGPVLFFALRRLARDF